MKKIEKKKKKEKRKKIKNEIGDYFFTLLSLLFSLFIFFFRKGISL